MALPPEQRFHFRDGTDVEDLEGLKKKIERISYDEFYNHVNSEKNDFANWIGDVLQQRDLAEKLRKVTSIVETVELLNEALYPEENNKYEESLEGSGVPDFQKRIEEELFTQNSEAENGKADEPTNNPEFMDEIPEISVSPVQAPTLVEAAAEESSATTESGSEESEGIKESGKSKGSEEEEEPGEVVSLPSREEIEGVKLPGVPVTSTKPAHVPVTERLDRPVTKEEHMRFLTKESLFGVILGLITGFILGVVVALYA